MIRFNQDSEARIGKLQSEIDKLTLLSSRMKEALRNPFLSGDARYKYNMAIPNFEKKIKQLRGDIKAIQILESMDTDHIELPRHYQHHCK